MRDIVDDEQRRDCPQPLCAQRVPAAQGHLLRTPIMLGIIGACSSTMSKLRLDGSPQCLHCAASACVAPPCICPCGARNAACCTFTTGCKPAFYTMNRFFAGILFELRNNSPYILQKTRMQLALIENLLNVPISRMQLFDRFLNRLFTAGADDGMECFH